jgi:hypothetical protein
MIIKLTTLTRASRKADKSVNISFNTTTEQSVQEMAELDAMHNQTCIVAIKPEDTPFQDNELKDLDSIDMDLEDKTKTPSKRLRSVLYRLWEQENNGVNNLPTEFKEYYKLTMEKIITHYKGKLD